MYYYKRVTSSERYAYYLYHIYTMSLIQMGIVIKYSL